MRALIPFLGSTLYYKQKFGSKELNKIKADEFLYKWSGMFKITSHRYQNMT